MRAWLVRKALELTFGRLTAGDPSFALRLMAPDVHFRFPGDSDWGIDTRRRSDVAVWLQRFASFHPAFTFHDVAVKGPPWRMRAFVRFTDQMSSPPANGPYRNEVVDVITMRWARVTALEVFLDTEKVDHHFPVGTVSIRTS